MSSKMRSAGFTLLEVLVAMSITAVLGAGAFMVLSQGLLNKERVEARMAVLRQAQRIDRLLADDLMQMVARPIRDQYGDPRGALLASPPLSWEWTRTGWRDATTLLQQLEQVREPPRRSLMQRVAWRVEDQVLIREYWAVLDRDVDSEPRVQRLLEDVEMFALRFLDGDDWSEQWPPDQDASADQSLMQLPRGVEVRYQHPQLGEIVRLFPLAAAQPPAADGNRARGAGSEAQGEGG